MARARGRPRARAAPPAAPAGRVAQATVEGGLRAVALALPVVVVGGAMGPYDDAKAWALVVLASLTGVALVVRLTGARRESAARLPRWFTALMAAYAGWWIVATALSIAPGQSLLGTFGRGHGLLVTLASLALFAAVASECRSLAAGQRLAGAILLGSVPVCLFAAGQLLGWNPFPTSWDPALELLAVRSTLGNHVTLGSYLVLTVPLALVRLEAAWRAWRAQPASAASHRAPPASVAAGAGWVAGTVVIVAAATRWPLAWWALLPWSVLGAVGWAAAGARERGAAAPGLAVVLWSALLAGQVGVVLASRARGAFLAMLAGLALTGVLLLVRRRAWRLLAGACAALLLVVAFLAAINLSPAGRAWARGNWLVQRLARITDVQRPSPVWFRLQVWRGIAEGWGEQVRGVAVVPDTAPRARALVGFGPDTQGFTIGRMAAAHLGELPAWWRGTRAQYLIDRAHNDALDHLVTGGLGGLGLGLAVAAAVVALGARRIREATDEGELALRLGCFGAFAAALVDAQFGVVTPPSRALAWMVAGLLVVAWSPAAPPRPARGPRTLALASAAAALLAIAASTAWLLGSVAYAAGVRRGTAGDLAGAHRDFARASRLTPWLSLAAEAHADVALRRAMAAGDATQREVLLAEAQAGVDRARALTQAPAAPLELAARTAFARWRAGDAAQLPEARREFARAVARSPWNAQLLASAALAEVEAGDTAAARAMAQRAVSLRHDEWLAWAVLARVAHAEGRAIEARTSMDRAVSHAPAALRQALEGWLR